ncbi:NO-inducible flavohemoprotein [Alkalicoccus urumqiensis]|uniref:Flavohemoprotein n=1 Tax=Alkalicoccus urumqiensis TaxID=1548213 RepID=A0A2P6MIB5_ALKUR|nr:NO-inducible flavohemoprotein [Alkalicoccus urumqiensis]PRO66010.1 NO-inducible flavohemoprotein [Alkalicoccus urumqiensis]
MLTETQKETIKATIPVLEQHGTDVTTHFYSRLFEDHPELLNIFNHVHQETGEQPRALAYSLYQAAVNIDQLESILPLVRQVAHKHRSIGVQAEHYPVVGEYLLRSMQEKLGLDADDPVIEAWGAAYGIIADIFIQVEKGMYDAAGWEGFQPMIVVDKVNESSEITSFYLKRENDEPLPSFEPGQYLSIRAEIPGENYLHIRQYSLSDEPELPYYRISVKREAGPDGRVSSWLHQHVEAGDTIYASAPAGDFTMKEGSGGAAFIAGGVGITPLLSMFKQETTRRPERPLTLIHAVRNEAAAGLQEDAAKAASAGIRRHFVVYEHPEQPDAGDAQGRITPAMLQEFLPEDTTEIYLCGPEAFMTAVYTQLQSLGYNAEQIHYEYFGPGMALPVTN